MYANEEYVELLTDALSEQTNIKIVPDKKWSLDLKKNELHYNKDSLRHLPFDVVRGSLLHEIGHARFTRPHRTRLLKKYGQSMQGVYNYFEDMRIETDLNHTFGNFSFSALNSFNTWNFNMQSDKPKIEGSKLEQFLKLSLLRYYSMHSSQIHQEIGYDAGNIINNTHDNLKVDEDVRRKHYEHQDEINNIITRASVRSSTQKMQRLIDKELYPLIKEWLESPQDSQMPEVGGTEMPAPGDGFKAQEDKTVPFEKPTERQAEALLHPYSMTLAQRLESILKERAMTRWYGNYRRGKLLSKNAYKVVMPDENRIFSRKNEPDKPQYSIYMALDNSGSMNGTRAVYTFMGSVLLKKACKLLGFKSNFYSYDTTARKLDRLDDYNAAGGGTYDTSALRIISEDLNPEEENIVFVLTDGGTSRDYDFEPLYKKMTNHQNAVIYGIGIGQGLDAELKSHYENSVCVNRVEELPLALINIMQRIIHR